MLICKSTQRKVKFDYPLLRKRLERAREILKISPYNLAVWFASGISKLVF